MTIPGLNFRISATTAGFTSSMSFAAKSLGAVRAGFNRATDSARAFKSLTNSVGDFKLAGKDTLSAFQTTLAVARSELRKFGRNRDVQIALEIGREYLDESWIKARTALQSLVNRSGILVAAKIVADKSSAAVDWIERQRRQLTKQITVRLALAGERFAPLVTKAQTQLEKLNKFRAFRILLAATDRISMPAQAAFRMLGPLSRLAGHGVIIALKATHVGIATGVNAAKKALSGLRSFGSSIMSALSGGFALVGLGIAALGGYSFTSMVKGTMDSIDATAKLSDRLGIATDALIGLRYAGDLAGVSAETLTGGLEKMLNNLSDAATKGGEASVAFQTLGLDAKQLAQDSPDVAFKKIADGIVGIENPIQRASLAMDIFGKSGQQLLPLMLSGADGISAAQKEAEKLGLTFNRVDAAKVEAANDAFTRLSAVMTGAFQSLAITIAPFIEVAANKLTELATNGQGLSGIVVNAFEAIVKGVAYAADYLSLLKAGFKLLQASATLNIWGIVKAIDLIGSKFVDLLNLLPGVNVKWTSFTGQLADGLLIDAQRLQDEASKSFKSFQDGDSSKAVGKFFDDVRAKSTAAATKVAENGPKMGKGLRDVEDQAANLKKVADALDDIQKSVSQFGLGDSQKKLLDFTALGATPEQIAKAKELLSLQDQLTTITSTDTGQPLTDFAAKMEQLQKLYSQGKITADQFSAIRDSAKKTLNEKLTDDAKSVIDSVQTPLEAYQKELEKLNELLDNGFISKDVFDRAAVKAKTALDAADPKNDVQQAALTAVRSNSADAQKLAFDNAQGIQRTLGKDEIAKKQLDVQGDMATYLKGIFDNTKGGTTLVETDL